MADHWKCPCGETATIKDAHQYIEMGVPLCIDCDREMDRDWAAESLLADAQGEKEIEDADQLAYDIVSGWNLEDLRAYAAQYLSSEFLENPEFYEASKHEYQGD